MIPVIQSVVAGDRVFAGGEVLEPIYKKFTNGTTVVAAVPGKRIRVLGLVLMPPGLTAPDSVEFAFRSGDSTGTVLFEGYLSQPLCVSYSSVGWFETEDSQALYFYASPEAFGHLVYVEVP